MTVEDRWQDQGLGTELLRRAIVHARNRGLKSLYMICLTDNRRMQAIAGLSGGIAHRFNNLLTAIQGYGELALQTETASESIRPHLVRIQEASRTAAQMPSASRASRITAWPMR